MREEFTVSLRDRNSENAPRSVSAPHEIALRDAPFFSTRLLAALLKIWVSGILGGLMGSAALIKDMESAWRFLTVIGIYLSVMTVFIVARHFYLRHRGGTPPWRFTDAGLQVPVTVNIPRTALIAYDDILSITQVGGGWFKKIVIDTRKKTFFYAPREFVDADPFARINMLLQERILALPDGEARWKNIMARFHAAQHMSVIKPWATWGICVLAVAAYVAEVMYLLHHPVFGILDIGVNAPFLVLHGEWFRLVTANLLHVSIIHILGNVLGVLIMGALLEREIGMPRMLMVVLFTGIASQFVSTLWLALGLSSALMSLGISGALFGMLGAHAYCNYHFAPQMPGLYRFSKRVWIALFILNFVFVPLTSHTVDSAAHTGGFLSGLFIGWWLCRKHDDITQMQELDSPGATAFALFAALWGGAAFMMLSTLDNIPQLQEDHAAMIKAQLVMKLSDPIMDNDVAWELVTNPAVTHEQLEDALILSKRAAAKTITIDGRNGDRMHAVLDTLATVHYYLGHYEDAVSIEEPLARFADVFPSQLARFLEGYVQVNGVRYMGQTSPADMPQLTLNAAPAGGNASVTFTFPNALPKGAMLYALVREKGNFAGLLRVTLKPLGPHALQQTLTIDTAQGGVLPSDTQGLTVTLAQLTTTDCADCTTNHALFYPYDKQIAPLATHNAVSDIAPRDKMVVHDYPTYTLLLPPGVSSLSTPMPIVVALSPTGTVQEMMDAWQSTARKQHWALMVSKTHRNNAPMAGLLGGVMKDLADVQAHYPVDTRRVVMAGFGGGGMSAQYSAYLYPQTVSVVVTNDGMMAEEETRNKDKIPHGKYAIFIASPTGKRYHEMQQDKALLATLGWKTDWVECDGGHHIAPPSVYERVGELIEQKFSCYADEGCR